MTETPKFSQGSLTDRGIIRVGGPDARAFLHSLLSADIAALGEGDATYAALLSPQGKILFDMFVLFDGIVYFLDCAARRKADLMQRLSLYRLRANLQMNGDGSLEAGVAPGETIHPLRYLDPRCPELGWRLIVPESRLTPASGYHAERIKLGLADSEADLAFGDFFPHEANLDQLGGVSFTKGCYVGQEVVARMEHRGLARSRILPVALSGEAPPPRSAIRAGETLIGTLLSAEGLRALALIRLDRLAEADVPLLTEGVTVSVLKPSWARFSVPEAGGKE